MGMLYRAFTGHVSHFFAQLPFNLNWMIRVNPGCDEFLKRNPIILADVGARGGSLGELESLSRYVGCHGFEPDEEECRVLNSSPQPWGAFFKAYPYFIGEPSADADFNLYKRIGESSAYGPDERYRRNFSDGLFAVDRTAKVKSASLDEVYKNESLDLPDIIKLDTQGSELTILEHSPVVLSNASIVEVEVEFIPIYERQPLFHEVQGFMLDNGFELLYLDRCFANRNSYQGMARGQVISADALYGRREDRLGSFTPDRLLKYVILLINFGHIDLAHQICGQSPQIEKGSPFLKGYFNNKNTLLTRTTRRALAQLDKLLCLLLHLRKCNRLSHEFDRGWPIR